jgi:predicted Zn-ribbon and HTH transcriptional regulator
VEEAEAAALCRVCYAAACDAAYVGCGHTFCRGCIDQAPRCPVCRKASQRIRLYK